MYFNSIKEYTKYLVDRKRENEKIRYAYDLLEESDDNIDQVIRDQSLSPQEYIEVIALRRKEGYSKSAGGGSISAEHQTDLMYMNNPWKFIEEFLQNADDCKYKGKPTIEISVDEEKGTIEFVYNEEGFTREDIWALTAFEQSTKSDENDGLLETEEEGVFYKEKTGRKGIGFKSVFSLKASNIRIHIRSNEYSFILDKAVGSIMPIWEDFHSNDGNTHVIVEVIEPEHSPNEIYTEFKDAFCVESTSRLFEKNPVLFMHRLKDITVNWIAANGAKECFSIVMDYDHLNDQYEEPFEPEKPILAGIKHEGQYYRKQFSFLEIQLITDNQIVTIPCVRETQMVDLCAKYRNISIIAPILTSNMDFQCDNGALFRTFPLEDNTFNIPFALDAPFELNTARKAIEYNDAKGARKFNNKIISLLFDGNGLLIDFMLFLRNLKDIQVDQYFRNDKVTLFENDANKDGKKRLIPIIDLTMVMRNIPVFRSYDNKEYLPLTRVFTVDPEVYSWLDATRFLTRVSVRAGKTLASEIYSKNSIVGCQSVVDSNFTIHLNKYLDSVEEKYGIDNGDFLNFIEQKLYPYLQKKESELIDINAYASLKVFISDVKTQKKVIRRRETCNEGFWFTFTSKNNLSLWKYRIVESSPVVLNPLINVLKSQAKLKKLDEEFSGDITKVANSRCHDWDDIKGFIQAAYYYGFDLGKLTIDALGKYAVSKELDTHKNNYLRDAGILEIIPDDDIIAFCDVFENSNDVVDYLYKIGLRDWRRIGKLDKEVKTNYRLYPDSLHMFQAQEIEIVKQYLEIVFKFLRDQDKKVCFSFSSFDKCHDDIKLALMRNNQFIATDYYKEICKEILNKSKYWKTDSNEYAEMIVRARMQEKIDHLNNKKALTFTIQYVIENKLESLAPFSFAVSIFCSALILITFLYIVNYLLCKKGFFAPGLNIACIFLSCGVALFAVYTLGYDVSKEIYETNPEYLSEVFDVASGKKNSEKTSIAVENELTSRDETSEDEMTDQDASDNSPDSSEIGEYETYNYVTEVNGHRKDWALRASEFNKRANLMFTYAAALLIPLNWYKDEARKSDKNIDKNI